MDWLAPFIDMDRREIATLGTVVMYSRQASANFSAVAAFPLSGILSTGGEYASPLGPIYGSFFIRISDIPLGPQKGDELSISDLTYKVQEIVHDDVQGSATLKLRWTGA